MMSAGECRARARLMLELARRAPNEWARDEWETMARDWQHIAAMADFQGQTKFE